MWVKRLFCTDGKPWKYVCNFHLDCIGGINNVRSNFDLKVIPATLPSFYYSCLSEWAKFSRYNPTTPDEVLCVSRFLIMVLNIFVIFMVMIQN